MKPICAICIHCFMILLFFPSFVSAQDETETLYYDWNISDSYILSTKAKETPMTVEVFDGELSISFEGEISSGKVASRSVITGKIRLAASDTVAGDRTSLQFKLVLEKNGASIGSTTVSVIEGSSLVYATYSVSFSTTDSFKASDTMEWVVEETSAGTTEGRGIQLDSEHSYLIFPLYEFPWSMFMGAVGSHSSSQP